MTNAGIIGIASAALALVLLVTGWWRLAFVPFRIRSARMTVRRLGLLVHTPDRVARVDEILKSFAGGFNAMITSPARDGWERYCDSLPAVYSPFGHEGAAMGYTVRRLFRYKAADFERELVKKNPGMRYLYYVGLGFWSGMRGHKPDRLAHVVDGLDKFYRYLCYDGYGFKHAFFDYPGDDRGLEKLNRLQGYARNAAYQGVGRAFWFLYMEDLETLVEHLRRLGPYAGDAAAGVGLAMVFTAPDRIDRAIEEARRMPSEWHDDLHLGMCFALKARCINDPDQFDQDVDILSPRVQEAVRASIRECDRVELQTRAMSGPEGYRIWRERVTAWMAENVQYPISGVRRRTPDSVGLETP